MVVSIRDHILTTDIRVHTQETMRFLLIPAVFIVFMLEFCLRVTCVRHDITKNITLCVIIESDSYYTSYKRAAAIIDLAVSQVNAFVLPEHIRFTVVYQSSGPSCSLYQYTAVSSVMSMLTSGVTCNVFLGAGTIT